MDPFRGRPSASAISLTLSGEGTEVKKTVLLPHKRQGTQGQPNALGEGPPRITSRPPLLVALDPMRDDPDSEKAKFLARAWQAAFNKAKELSWI